MALEWNDLSVIMAVCRAGSLSGAARTLGHNHSTVFRRINAIEQSTGVRFFERLPHGYAMTDAGRAALACAERIEGEVHVLGRQILGQDMRLQGKVTVTAPEGLAVAHAPRMLAEFRRMHPDVSVEIVGGASNLDLARREADLAIRATRKPPDASLGRRVCDFRFTLYASPKYLDGRSRQPLAEHDWCTLTGITDWLVPLVWKKKEHGEQRVMFSSPSVFAVVNAAAEGVGITLLPCYLGDADERLVRVSDPIEGLTIELWVLTHPDLRHTARVKALLSSLHEALHAERGLFEGKRVRGKSKPLFDLPA